MSKTTKTPTPAAELRRAALREAEACVCRDRNNTYGDAEDEFARVATIWSVLFSHQFDAADVALAMSALKTVRAQHNKAHRDNWVDLAGYASCGAGIMARKAEVESQYGAH